MITPEQLAAAGSEHAHQKALFCWAASLDIRLAYPQLALMFAIPNGGARDKITASKLKAEGVKAGVPDIFLPVPMHRYTDSRLNAAGLFIELKRPKAIGITKGSTQENQDDWIDKLREQGYKVVVAYGWLEAKSAILEYLS